MALPSLSDVVLVIVLLVPGFIAIVLFRWLAIFEKKLTDFNLVVSSIFLSLLIYSIMGWHTGNYNFDAIRDSILLPENLFKILGLSLLLGVVPGLLVRGVLRRTYVRGDCWEASMNAASEEGSWVIIHTSDGNEYKGILHYTSTSGFQKELSIRNPKCIIRNSEGYLAEEVDIGKEIFFTERNIARIVFFKEV